MFPSLPVVLLGSAAAALVARTVDSFYSTARSRREDWRDLVAGLHPVDLEGLTVVARDFLEPSHNQLKLEPEQLWQLIGGWEGLNRMRRNAEIMLALAAYTQRWNFDEGVIVTERMRRDALKLRRAVQQLKLHLIPRFLLVLPARIRFNFPFEVHEVASSYYLMRQRLLALYETSHAGLYPVLAASV